MAVQAGTGRILTMVQNKRYSQDPEVIASGPEYSAINLNVDASVGGGDGFQTGSAYKVFTLAEWLDSGHTLLEQFDTKRKNWTGFTDSCNGTQNYSGYNPKNAGDGGYADTGTALDSTVYSLNTGFTGMSHLLDLCEIRKTAEAFGVHRADGDDLVQSAASVLGTNEIAPLTMAVAYAGIADDGTTCTPVAISTIIGPDGAEIPPAESECHRAVSADVAHAMQYAMLKVTAEGRHARRSEGRHRAHHQDGHHRRFGGHLGARRLEHDVARRVGRQHLGPGRRRPGEPRHDRLRQRLGPERAAPDLEAADDGDRLALRRLRLLGGRSGDDRRAAGHSARRHGKERRQRDPGAAGRRVLGRGHQSGRPRRSRWGPWPPPCPPRARRPTRARRSPSS
ncbi:penicillin-binding transpeptidase domain-containing protein [Rathayibacter oskolensis]|nr:penicillin-binding transpeptidase domain-containing protein [Rathayibacter oskolensis]WKK70622.1 penicillin-binding transpeptidase domain-containing protein [Rathayibacter oskolensis]